MFGIIGWMDSLGIDHHELLSVLGSLICLSDDRVYHRRVARMLTTVAITEREAIILKLNEELLLYQGDMDET